MSFSSTYMFLVGISVIFLLEIVQTSLVHSWSQRKRFKSFPIDYDVSCGLLLHVLYCVWVTFFSFQCLLSIMFSAFMPEGTSGNGEACASSLSVQCKKEEGSQRPENCHELSYIFHSSVLGQAFAWVLPLLYWFVEFSPIVFFFFFPPIVFSLLFLTWFPHG